MNNSDLKATLVDYANALYDAGEKANSNLVYQAIDLIEDLEDEVSELQTRNDQLEWGTDGEDEF